MFGNAVDISTYQGNISFEALKAAGVKYVLIRIGFGRESYQIDNQFMNNYRKAKAAGIPVGGYFFSYADSAADAIVEANNINTSYCYPCVCRYVFSSGKWV